MNALIVANEVQKRRYLHHLTEAQGLAKKTIDEAARAIADYERLIGGKDFRRYRAADAIAYRKALLARDGRRAQELSSRATVVTKLRQVKKFFGWLCEQRGYRSRILRADLEYFNVSARDARLADEPGDKPTPTIEQVCHVIRSMPAGNDLELRNRALIAFMLMTGVRVSACISLKLKHLLTDGNGVDQDAREVRTKFSKSSTVFFFPVPDDIRTIVKTYVDHLKVKLLFGENDPLFPRGHQRGRTFQVTGLARAHWKCPGPVWDLFKTAFTAAGLEPFTPHSIRRALARLGLKRCQDPEQWKTWSMNLSHEDQRTTWKSYSYVPQERRRELMRRFGHHMGDPTQALIDKYGQMLSDPVVQAMLDRMKGGV